MDKKPIQFLLDGAWLVILYSNGEMWAYLTAGEGGKYHLKESIKLDVANFSTK